MINSLKISLCVHSWHQRKTGEKTETKKNLIFSVSENGGLLGLTIFLIDIAFLFASFAAKTEGKKRPIDPFFRHFLFLPSYRIFHPGYYCDPYKTMLTKHQYL